jgi:glycosyltransferase involved in cell wall biosynthesis
MKFFFIQTHTVEIQVAGGTPIGGAVVETLVWMKALNALGNEIYQAKFEEDHRILKEEFSWINMIPIYNSKKFKKRLVWFSYRFPKLFRALKGKEIDFLYTSLPTWHIFYSGLICKILGIKHIIRIANDKNVKFELDKTQSFLDKLLIHNAYLQANLIIAQSEFQYQELRRKYPNKKIEKLYNPIELKKDFLNVKTTGEGYIAWVANFRFQKNLKLLFKIATILPFEKFKIAGQPLIPMDEETEVYVQNLKSLSNVEFVGIISQSDILTFFSHSKFLISTSRYEGFSNTFLEAMMTGTPILTTENVNPDGIIDTFGLGYIYKDENDLKEILNGISESDYIQKSKNCIEYVQNNHDHLVLGKKLLDFLKE